MGTADLLAGAALEQLLHAGGATAVLVGAHHHGGVLVIVELAHAQEALLLDLVFNYALDLRAHHGWVDQLHLEPIY